MLNPIPLERLNSHLVSSMGVNPETMTTKVIPQIIDDFIVGVLKTSRSFFIAAPRRRS